MENLIDKSYFWGERELGDLFGNSGLLGNAGSQSSSNLDKYIAKYQDKYLKKMFGEELGSDLPVELQSLVINTELCTSPIADYVYFFLKRNNRSVTTAMGEKKLNAPNTLVEYSDEKPYRAMFDCIQESIRIHTKLYDDETIDVTIGEETVTLNYLNDIYPNINPNDDIFDECYNIFGI